MVERKQHLVVVDVQNDFCDPRGFFPTEFGYKTKGIDEIVKRIEETITFCRQANIPVVYTKTIGDDLSKSQRERYEKMQKFGFLKDNSWGSELFMLSPASDESTFKKSGYDAFNSQKFRSYVDQFASNLVLVGFYSDVCIDATAKTADQIGLETSIIADCSTSCFRSHEESLKFMQTFYGIKVFPNLEAFRKLIK